jgi:hypothetical protein
LVESDFSLLPEEIKAQLWTFMLCSLRYGISFPPDIICSIFSEILYDFWQNVCKDVSTSEAKHQQEIQGEKKHKKVWLRRIRIMELKTGITLEKVELTKEERKRREALKKAKRRPVRKRGNDY